MGLLKNLLAFLLQLGFVVAEQFIRRLLVRYGIA
jgi:hypothetical protein